MTPVGTSLQRIAGRKLVEDISHLTDEGFIELVAEQLRQRTTTSMASGAALPCERRMAAALTVLVTP